MSHTLVGNRICVDPARGIVVGDPTQSGVAAPCVCGPQGDSCWLRAVVCASGRYYGPAGDVFVSQSQWEALGSPEYISYSVSGSQGTGTYCYRVLSERVWCCSTDPEILQDAPYLPTFAAGPTGCDDPQCQPLECPDGALTIPARTCSIPECNTDADLEICTPSYSISLRERRVSSQQSFCRTHPEMLAEYPEAAFCFPTCPQPGDPFVRASTSQLASTTNISAVYRESVSAGTSNTGTWTLITVGCNPSTSTSPWLAPDEIPCAGGFFRDGRRVCGYSDTVVGGFVIKPGRDYLYTIDNIRETELSTPWLYYASRSQSRYSENIQDDTTGVLRTVDQVGFAQELFTLVIRLSAADPDDPAGIGLPSIDCGYDPASEHEFPDVAFPPDTDNPGAGSPISPNPAPLVAPALPRPSGLTNALRRLVGRF